MKFYVWRYKWGVKGNKYPLAGIPLPANPPKDRPKFGIHVLDEIFFDLVNAVEYCKEETARTNDAYYIVPEVPSGS